MSTLRKRIDDPAELLNPNVTKVVVERPRTSRLYFSRAPIPHTREGCPAAPAWRHVGLYVYRRDTLLRLASAAADALEQAEALEQLRALAHGIRIKCVETAYESIGVDTPADLERVRAARSRAQPDGRRAGLSMTQEHGVEPRMQRRTTPRDMLRHSDRARPGLSGATSGPSNTSW